MKKRVWGAALSGVVMALSMSTQIQAQALMLSGKWLVLPDGKSALTLLTLIQSGDSVTGKWEPPKGVPSKIENGKVAGNILTFSFVRNKQHFEATGRITGSAISFVLVGPKKWGKPETIHGQAARAGDQ